MGYKVVKIVVTCLFAIVAVAFFGFVVMYLWNWLMPYLFGLPVLSFFEAIGLLLLSKILFSGFGGCSGKSSKKSRMKEKLSGMTPEDREKFKERFKHKWAMHCKEKREASENS